MANKIKNKFSAPKATEFTPRDLVVDVKNGRLYYKSNYGVYEVRGSLFSSTTDIDEATQLGDSLTTEVIFNNGGIYDGVSNFTVTNIAGSSGTVNIGKANISQLTANLNADSKTISNAHLSNVKSFTANTSLDIGSHGFTAQTLTADGLTSGRIIFAGSGGTLSDDSGFEYDSANDRLTTSKMELTGGAGSGVAGKVRLGIDTKMLEIRTESGQTRIGAYNNFYSHFYTTKEKFYFEKPIVIDKHDDDGNTLGYSITSYVTPTEEASGDEAFGDLILTTNRRGYNNNGTNGGAIKIFNNDSGTTNTTRVEVRGDLKIIQNGDSTSPGKLRATSDIIAFASDKRLKENIINIPNPLDKIKHIRGVYYDWKSTTNDLGFFPTRKTNEIGMIAQEVEKVIPQAIEPAPFNEEYKTIKYDRIIPLLVECIKDQQKQIDDLKKLINKK